MQIDSSLNNVIVHSFYINHHVWLRNWLAKKVGSTFDAADLAQDTFTKLLSKNELTSIIEPRAYITNVAHGLMANFFRRRDIESAYLDALAHLGGSDDANHANSAETQLILLERIIALDTMLNGLSHNARAAFLLHRVDGMPYAEIAQELGVTVSSIKKYIAKALLHCATIA